MKQTEIVQTLVSLAKTRLIAIHAPLAHSPEWETQNLIMIFYFSEMV